jgi:hypothetical protein
MSMGYASANAWRSGAFMSPSKTASAATEPPCP